MNLKIKNLNQLDIYKIFSNSVIPRPIAWISTISKNNILNLAPFSYFTPLSSSPATFIVSIGHKENNLPKDTLKNLRETKKCSITIADINQLNQLHLSATSLEYNKSEFKEFDIKYDIINKNYPAVPKNSNIVFFGKYYKEIELEDSKTIPVVIKIEELFIDDSLIDDKENLYFNFLNPIARVGAKYFELGEELKVNNGN